MTASRSPDTSLQGGLQHLASTFETLSALEKRLAEVEFDLTGRNAFNAPDLPDTGKWDKLDLLPRMGETVHNLAELTQTLRQRLDLISNSLHRQPAIPNHVDAVEA